MARYTYEVEGNTVRCISSYEGKPVVGVAKCDPRDKFDEDIGKYLAKVRCDLKVAEKRVNRANKKECKAVQNFTEAHNALHRANEYLKDAMNERDRAEKELLKLSNILSKLD